MSKSAAKSSGKSPPAATDASVLTRLFEVIESRRGADPGSSYTAKLFGRGVPKIAQKLGEEAVETVVAATAEGREEIVAESADLLYHLLVLWAATGVSPADVWVELAGREGVSGVAEKASRKDAPKDGGKNEGKKK